MQPEKPGPHPDDVPREIRLASTDHETVHSLRRWLEMVDGLDVDVIPGTAEEGELGALDTLALIGSGTVLSTVFHVLGDWFAAKGGNPSVVITSVDGKISYEITAENLRAKDLKRISDLLDRLGS